MKKCTLVSFSMCLLMIYLLFVFQVKGMKVKSMKSGILALSNSIKEINNTLSIFIYITLRLL